MFCDGCDSETGLWTIIYTTKDRTQTDAAVVCEGCAVWIRFDVNLVILSDKPYPQEER